MKRERCLPSHAIVLVFQADSTWSNELLQIDYSLKFENIPGSGVQHPQAMWHLIDRPVLRALQQSCTYRLASKLLILISNLHVPHAHTLCGSGAGVQEHARR